MSKRLLVVGLLALSLTACGTDSSWEDDQTVEISNRIVPEQVKVDWQLEQNQIPRQDSTLQLQITNKEEPIDEFEMTHEKLLHLIVVSKDLSYFNHIHPQYEGEGLFKITNQFLAGGDYRVIADFQPANGGTMSKMDWITVEGKEKDPEGVKVDELLEKTVDGKRVTLTLDSELAVNKEMTMQFSLYDEKTDEDITDLEPYLGSIGHVVVLSKDAEQYLHVHALENQGNGPNALFETSFPASGVYKIWAQFQKDGQVFTVPYVIEVP